MEKPYKGRATIQDNFIDLQIIIPAQRNWFVIIVLGSWLCGWLMGEIFALNSVVGLFGENPGRIFILFWLICWSVGGFLALRAFLWNLKGKEIITIGQNRLTINKEGVLFFKPKTYDLNEIKNIRVQDDNDAAGGLLRSKDFSVFYSLGTIRFDYGLQTVKFAEGIDEAEANFILNKLKERRLLTQKNYSLHVV